MRNFWLTILLLTILGFSFSGCDPVRKLAKSNDITERDSAASYYFKNKKYDQAVFLYEELLGIYRSTPRAEEIFYYYAYCRYYMGELVSAAYYFEEFTKQFPRSKHREEFTFLAANSYYRLADPWYLDQKYTLKALEYLQLFVTKYPKGEKFEEASEKMRELRERLARKAFEQAKLYYKIGQYKAATQAFKNVIEEYPDSDFREETQYLLVESSFQLAEVSITSKKKERYENAQEAAKKFMEKFPENDKLKAVTAIQESAQEEITDLEADEQLKEEEKLYRRFERNMEAALAANEKELEKEAYDEALKFHLELREKYPDSEMLEEAEKYFRDFEKKLEKEAKNDKEAENQ